MSKFATLERDHELSARLKVVGVGGGGCNAIESMIKRGLTGVEYVAINTDAQVLQKNSADHKVQVGVGLTKGLGAGADPEVGKKATEEDREKIKGILNHSDMVFVTAGMGGGTGTGGAPIVASIAKSVGALVIGIVTKPFRWEGKKRMMNAEAGIQELRQFVDSLIVIPNERILNILDSSVGALTAFDKPNEVLYEATRGIADIITVPGIINVDFADVRSVMNHSGEALMGCGISSGENRSVEAAQKAISSPLLEGISIKGAKNILLNVTGSSNLTMQEIEEGNRVIYEAAGEEANIIFGLVNKEEMNEYVSYTVIATGFSSRSESSGVSKLRAEKPEKPKEETERFPIGGFNRRELEIEDEENLDVPTIFRVKGSQKKMFESAESEIKGGFKIEQMDAFESEKAEEKKKKKEFEMREQDSSSFLRMMMD
ncbi:MAG: cell division protein FtsZ [Melioribacteraceae bacterium]|jgi:cell division protein FtsZ|nr:MAG: cell division protein FtsZ [Ignavibacteriales bacterium]WKZ70502.1 MAG: cell division protein FtsZ [Melioribacteraceae bacterium]